MTPERLIKLIEAEATSQSDNLDGVPSVSSQLFNALIDITAEIEPFDWANWDEGRHAIETLDFSNLDREQHLKLFVALIRSDRFCEGTLYSAAMNGLLLAIASSLRSIW